MATGDRMCPLCNQYIFLNKACEPACGCSRGSALVGDDMMARPSQKSLDRFKSIADELAVARAEVAELKDEIEWLKGERIRYNASMVTNGIREKGLRDALIRKVVEVDLMLDDIAENARIDERCEGCERESPAECKKCWTAEYTLRAEKAREK